MADEQGFVLFKRTRDVELKIAEFLTNIIHAGFLFSAGIERYFDKGANAEFVDIAEQVSVFESKNDTLRRDVEKQLYIQMILPDVRSDIIKLLEGCDRVINRYEEILILMTAQKIKLPKELHDRLLEMVKSTLECVNALIVAVRCFFSGLSLEEFARQASFLEHQVDKQALALKTQVFTTQKWPLAFQMQLNDFIKSIERISDIAEDVADNVTIMSAKHSL